MIQPLQPDDTRFGYVKNHWVLNVPDVLLVVSTKEATDLADWFMSVGCDVGLDLYDEMGIDLDEPIKGDP
jgi:hypothetical protein